MNRRGSIAVESVSMQYDTPAGPVRVVDDVTLRVEPGASLAITGASGSGKSTLLGLIAGLETPTAGRVHIDGVALWGLGDRDRARLRRTVLGLVFQTDNLHPFLTAQENVALGLALRGSGTGDPRSLLTRLGLGEQRHKLPDQLSGGQRQRVAVARALIHDPGVVLADEPTGSLDAHNSEIIVDALLDAQRSAGSTLVVVTHDPAVAARLDRTVRLSDGRIERAGDA